MSLNLSGGPIGSALAGWLVAWSLSSTLAVAAIFALLAAGALAPVATVILVLVTLGTALLGVFLGYLVLSRERARRRSERTVEVLRQSLLPTALPAPMAN